MTMKKSIAFMLVMTLVISMFPIQTFAAPTPITLTATPTAGGTPTAVAKGTTSPSLTSATSSTAITLSANPNDGYEFAGWLDTSAPQYVPNDNSPIVSFELGTNPANIEATYAPLPPNLNSIVAVPFCNGIATEVGGTVDVEGAYSPADVIFYNGDTAKQGEFGYISITPEPGYKFTGWTVLSSDLSIRTELSGPASLPTPSSISDGTLFSVFMMPDETVTMVANFAEIQDLTINVEPAGSGIAGASTSTSSSGLLEAGTDEKVSIYANANGGYKFTHWSVDTANATVTAPNSRATDFVVPNADVTLTAHFEPLAIAPGNNNNGSNGNNGNSNSGGGNNDDSDDDDVYSTIYADNNLNKKDDDKATENNEDLNYPDSDTEYPSMSATDLESALMLGDPDGNFRPQAILTRAEVAQVIYNTMYDGGTIAAAPFTDVESDMWYSEAVNFAYENGYITGYPDGTFDPTAPITRAEVLVILDNVMVYPAYDSGNMYNDIEGHWASEYINSAGFELGLTGFPDGSFKPDDNITRGDFAIILANATDRTEYQETTTFGDVYPTDYYYEYVMAVTNPAK